MTSAQSISTSHPITWKDRFQRALYFFPLRLLLLHFKKNHFLLFFWLILFGFTTHLIAPKYGVSYLFLYPEYMGQNSLLSFGITGFALGGFIIAFNLYTYILHGFRFPFIATLNKPFQKFSLNNLVIPLAYIITYLVCSASFQHTHELVPTSDIVIHLLGFLGGIGVFILLARFYFIFTNKNAGFYAQDGSDKSSIQTTIHKKYDWTEMEGKTSDWKVITYLAWPLNIRLARSSEHYKRALVEKALSQNHVNATVFEALVVASFLVIGFFRNIDFLILPAAASAILFCTVLLMLVSALFSWIKGWTLSVFILAFIAINLSWNELTFLNNETHAYGLDYDLEPVHYDDLFLKTQAQDIEGIKADSMIMIGTLQKWLLKNQELQNTQKPKLLLVSTSGGGLRSSLWTTEVLEQSDDLLENELMDLTHMITGSSGGMVGAAYYRAEWFNRKSNPSAVPSELSDKLGKDLLNPIIFSIATNDLFIRYQKFEHNGISYSVDRAHSFETELTRNTDDLLNHSMGQYKRQELASEMPLIYLTPTIINDGRRLVLSAGPNRFFSSPPSGSLRNGLFYLPEYVSLQALVSAKESDKLSMLSAIRMNATFPYVLPITTLPTEPEIGVMDSGLRDNFGLKTHLRFVNFFKDWIEENTSGVVILQVRDTPRYTSNQQKKPNLIQQFTAPLGSLYGNLFKMQDYNNEEVLDYINDGLSDQVEIVSFEMPYTQDESLSLSWHLTAQEKQHIGRAIQSFNNQASLRRLTQLMGYPPE